MQIRQSVEVGVLDEKTGEIVTKRANRTYSHGEEPSYIKLYLEDIMYWSDMPKQYAALTMALLKRMSYAGDEDGMCVVLVPRYKKAICKELGWKNERSINNALVKLVEGKILFRIDRSIYRFNPFFFGKGDWQDIDHLRMEVNYTPEKGRTFQTVVAYAEERNGQLKLEIPPEGEPPENEELPDTGDVAS